MPNKKNARAYTWRLRLLTCTDKQAAKVEGRLAERLQAKGKQAIASYVHSSPGCFDLTWKQDPKKPDGVTYNTVVSWAESFFHCIPLYEGGQFAWEIDLPATGPEDSDVHGAGGGPPLDSVAPVEPGGGTPLGGVAASCGGPPHSTAAGSDNRISQPEQPAVSPKKRCRLKTGASSKAGDVPRPPDDAAGGVPPRSEATAWMLQKALRLYRGVHLDDPGSAKYQIKVLQPFSKTRHSLTWSLHPTTSPGLKAPVYVKWHKDVCSEELLSEVHFLEQLRHPNIIKLIDVVCTNDKNCMVVEDGGENLGMRIKKHRAEGVPPCPGLNSFILQLLKAVAHVHSRDVVHADLKPQNMVVDEHGVLRLIDFGCAFVDLPGHRSKRDFEDTPVGGLEYGTIPYRAIEVMLGARDFGKPADMWAVGCIMFELIVCRGLFRPDATRDEVLSGCFSQLGQQDNIASLGALRGWKPQYAQITTSASDFWLRLGTAKLPAVYGRSTFPLLNFDTAQRPVAQACCAFWDAKVCAMADNE